MKTEQLVELKNVCTSCGGNIGIIIETGPHKKLQCSLCDKFIKFVKKNEFYNTIIKDNSTPTDFKLKYLKEMLCELNFKLDLILDNLDIKFTK